MTIAISVGTAKSINGGINGLRAINWQVTPDDRQTRTDIVGGVHVQDLGVVEEGEIKSCTAVFDAANWTLVKGYWTSRTLVTVIDEAGNTFTNMRVKVKSYTPVDRFYSKVTATLEFWGV
jgi:hypothetical protein